MGSTYWDERAKKYNNLQWVGKKESIERLLSFLCPNEDDLFLDLGCGTGKILTAVAPYVKAAYGFDLSARMLAQIKPRSNTSLVQGDGRQLPFKHNTFTKVVIRMVLHDILQEEDRSNIVQNAYRVLQPGGVFLIGEGVPPNQEVFPYLQEIFKLKEERVWFFPEDLEHLLQKNGFANVESMVYMDKDFDVLNWLNNDGTIPEENKQKIIAMYRNASPSFKQSRNMRDYGDKILIDTHFALVKGRK